MAPHIRSHRERRVHASRKRYPSAVVGTVRITQLDWKRVSQARSRGCKCSVAITSSLPLPPSHPVPASQKIRSHDFWRCINLYVCMYVGMYITQSFEWRGTHCASVTEQVVARVRLRPLMFVAACCRDRDQQTQLHEAPVWSVHYVGAARCAVDL